MAVPDEPALEHDAPLEPEEPDGEDLEARIRALVDGEPFAVLCTQGETQPYGSLLAVAFTDDLRHVLFATPVTTRKYRLLSSSQRVAMVVDDRSKWSDDLMRIQAVTLTGHAVRIDERAERERWAKLLVDRHPYLASFVRAESSALIRVDVLRYFHVERFQEVREWAPGTS